jgi:Tfp pilus assembly protein PilO
MIMIIINGLLVIGLLWWVYSLHSKIEFLEADIKSIEKDLKINDNDIKICLIYLTELQNEITEIKAKLY